MNFFCYVLRKDNNIKFIFNRTWTKDTLSTLTINVPLQKNYSTKQVDLLTPQKIFISSKSENFSVYDITKTVP